MKQHWVLSGVDQRAVRLRYRPAEGQPTITVSPILTIADVCRRLRKSRRQVYRYVHLGRLRPCAQVLGQWLIATTEVDRILHDHMPRFLRQFFWDVQLSSLSVDHHRDFILARLLEHGDAQALQWLLHAYPRHALVTFLQGRGRQVLSRRAWQFWALQMRLQTGGRRTWSWRSQGRHWGGLP